MSDGWIGVDLDGTLAFYDEWRGHEHIGPPVPIMLHRVKRWIRLGQEVRIVTARAAWENAGTIIRPWLRHCGLPALEITNAKDWGMITLWDDRCVQVEQNTGRPVCPEHREAWMDYYAG